MKKQKTIRTSKPMTVYLEDRWLSKINELMHERKKKGDIGGVSAVLRELIIGALNES